MKEFLERQTRTFNYLKETNPLITAAIDKILHVDVKAVMGLSLNKVIKSFEREVIQHAVEQGIRAAVNMPFKPGVSKEQKKQCIQSIRDELKGWLDENRTAEIIFKLRQQQYPAAHSFAGLLSNNVVSMIQAYYMWTVGKVIYQFDAFLLDELSKSAIDKLPTEVLHNLPYHCFYVKAEFALELSDGVEKCVGFWVYKDTHNNKNELCILVDALCSDGEYGIHLIRLNLEFNALTKAIDGSNTKFTDPDYNERKHTMFLRDVCKFIGAILYICSDRPDIQHTPSANSDKERKKDKKNVFKDPVIYECGYRISSMLQSRVSNTLASGHHEHQKGKAPHIRRAHWHTYLTGSVEEKKRILKWISPILINIENGECIATIKPVKAVIQS